MKQQRSFAFLVIGLLLTFTTCFVFSLPVAAQTQSLAKSMHNSIQAHTVSQRVQPAICYQAYVQNTGWQYPVCNGRVAGTTGQSLRMEAIKIWLINAGSGESVCYQAHVENIGWQSSVCDGQVAGTTGQSLRMEALQVSISNPASNDVVCYQASVENTGWQTPVCNGQTAGTTGQSLRMEAIKAMVFTLR